jgi:hypothetical protein
VQSPIAALQPRKLYAMIRACTTPDARARAALEFLRASAAADGGFLFLAQRGALQLAASSEREPPAGLSDHVAGAWSRFSPPQADRSRTLDAREMQAALSTEEDDPRWIGPGGAPFERRMLSTFRASIWIPVGIAALRAGAAGSLRPVRHAQIEALCDALIEAGDIAG